MKLGAFAYKAPTKMENSGFARLCGWRSKSAAVSVLLLPRPAASVISARTTGVHFLLARMAGTDQPGHTQVSAWMGGFDGGSSG